MKDFGTAVIMAGGKSSRMGFDKQLLTANQHKLSELTCQTLRQEFDDILVVTNRPELYASEEVRVCHDTYFGMGPLAGIHAALKNAQSKYVYIIACDMPVLNLDYIRYMKEQLRKRPAQICVTRKDDWLEPFNAFYSVELLKDLENRLQAGKSSLYYFINDADAAVISEQEAARYDKKLRMFLNLNTTNEYSAYLSSIL